MAAASAPVPRPPRILIAATAAAVGVGAALLVTRGAPGLPLDDAYIHLTYARKIAAGNGFAFNPGEHSLGFTSPLWVMLLALIDRLGADPVAAARLVGLAGLGAIVAVFFLMMNASLPRDRWGRTFAAAAAAAVALSGNLIWLCGSGMETALYLATALLAIHLLRPDQPRPIVGGLVLGLAVLARPTGLLLALILVAALAAHRRTRDAAIAAAAAAVLTAPWFVYSVLTTGFLLPPTRAGKLASNLVNSGPSLTGAGLFVWRHLVYFWKADPDLLLLLLLSIGLGLLLAVQRPAARRAEGGTPLVPLPRSPAALLAVWAGLDLLMHAFLFRSTAFTTPMHYLRYAAMLIPAIAGLAALGTGRLTAASVRRRALLLALLLIPVGLAGARLPAWRAIYLLHANQLAAEHRVAADWIRQNLAPDARVACLDIGIQGFYSGRYVIDLGGLTDPDILPDLARRSVGPYLVSHRATHYLEMVRHDSEGIVGVRADDGRLYTLVPMRSFQYPSYRAPMLLHSLGMNLYEVRPIKPAPEAPN